ncbi:hypothetical protein ABPG77_004629 [Micractinium sp. CCAP 211/92]
MALRGVRSVQASSRTVVRCSWALLFLLSISSGAAEHNKSEEALPLGTTWSAVPSGSEQDLLKWALAHSDPDELRRAAQAARHGAATGDPDFLDRQAKVQALLHQMREEPSEAELMQEAVTILGNASATQAQLLGALRALRYLVEPIDNANNLQGMGGLPPLVAQLAAGRPAALQAAAAHALGTAAQNNHQFQAQLLGDHPEVLHLLLALVGHSSEPFGAAGAAAGGPVAAADEPAASAGLDAGLKALYALSAILRLNAGARAAFYAAGGVHTLQQLLGSAAAGPGARKKAAALLADLVHLDAPAMHAAAAATTAAQQQHAQPGASAPAAALDFSAAVAAALQLLDVDSLPLQGGDLDLQEKALLVLLTLLGDKDDSGIGAARASSAAAAELIRDAGGQATLARLQTGLLAAAAAEEGDGEGGDSYARELLGLAQRVQQRVAATGSAAERDEL